MGKKLALYVKITILFGVAVLLCVGCATSPKVSDEILKNDTAALWAYSDELAKGGFYAEERVVLEEIVTRDPNNKKPLFRIEKSWFREAYKENDHKKYQKVKKSFQRFFDAFSFEQSPWEHPNTEEALWFLAWSYYKQIHPADRSQKETKDFIHTVQNRLFLHYPDTEYREAAERMLYRARRHLAKHEILIGDFYIRTWALSSAELRFKSILEDFGDLSLGLEVQEKLDYINHLKKNPTWWEKAKRLLFFQTIDKELDTVALAQKNRIEEQQIKESVENITEAPVK